MESLAGRILGLLGGVEAIAVAVALVALFLVRARLRVSVVFGGSSGIGMRQG